MNPEQRKEYNKKYYETHKETIIKTACEKIFCDKCGRSVIRNNIKSHQKSKICARHSQNKVAISSTPNEPTDLNLIEFNDENLKVLMEKLHNYLESKKTPDIQQDSKESNKSYGDLYTFEIVSVKDRVKKINDKIL
jgi:hypothetical protein